MDTVDNTVEEGGTTSAQETLPTTTTTTLPVLEGFETAVITVDGQQLTVAIAESGDQRDQGLQGVDSLPPGLEGMLFVFDEPTETSFHMRTVGLPLDIWWFDASGRLIGSNLMETCPDGDCPSYPTPGPVVWALETPAGDVVLEPGAALSAED